MTDIDALLDLASAAAASAARFLVEERPRDLSVAATKSSPTDIVTEMDRASERMIAAHILTERPDDAFLGEEGQGAGVTAATATSTPAGGRVRWIVDPIDGTVNYLHGIPNWAVSIGAELDGRVVAGVVVNPLVGETYTATLGGGARLNGEPISVNGAADLGRSLIGTGFSYAADRRDLEADVIGVVLRGVADLRRMGAASLDLCAVAAGRLDGYFERELQPWDLAAGGLIATEAGARVEGLHGEPASDRMVIAAGPALFGALHALVVRAGA